MRSINSVRSSPLSCMDIIWRRTQKNLPLEKDLVLRARIITNRAFPYAGADATTQHFHGHFPHEWSKPKSKTERLYEIFMWKQPDQQFSPILFLFLSFHQVKPRTFSSSPTLSFLHLDFFLLFLPWAKTGKNKSTWMYCKCIALSRTNPFLDIELLNISKWMERDTARKSHQLCEWNRMEKTLWKLLYIYFVDVQK